MKHLFIVETTEGIYLSPSYIDHLTHQVESLVAVLTHTEVFAQSICNQNSAIRGIYQIYAADQSKSPDQLGSSK